jgi:hypothetical protein
MGRPAYYSLLSEAIGRDRLVTGRVVAATLEVALCVIQWSWPVRIDANLISGL